MSPAPVIKHNFISLNNIFNILCYFYRRTHLLPEPHNNRTCGQKVRIALQKERKVRHLCVDHGAGSSLVCKFCFAPACTIHCVPRIVSKTIQFHCTAWIVSNNTTNLCVVHCISTIQRVRCTDSRHGLAHTHATDMHVHALIRTQTHACELTYVHTHYNTHNTHTCTHMHTHTHIQATTCTWLHLGQVHANP